MDYLVDPSFQGINRLPVLSFENNAYRRRYKQYFPPTVEIQNCNVMIDERNLLDQSIKKNQRTYDNIPKTAIGQVVDYANGCCLLDYVF